MFLCGKKKYVCDPEINSLPRKVVALQGPGGVSLVKEPMNYEEEVKLRY